MNQFCIIAHFETDDVTEDAPLVVGGFESAAGAHAYAARDSRLRGAVGITVAPYVQAAGVSREPLFTIYFEGHYEKFFALAEWYDMQTEHDDEDDCLGILNSLERNGQTSWAGVDYRINDQTEFTVAFRDLLANVAPKFADESGREAWLETLAALNEKVERLTVELKLTVSAEAHSDDYQREISFDATRFFVQASDQELSDLAACGFGGDYPADGVLYFFEGLLPDADSLLAWSRGAGNCGFEVHVDEQQAKRWIARFRPQVFERVEA